MPIFFLNFNKNYFFCVFFIVFILIFSYICLIYFEFRIFYTFIFNLLVFVALNKNFGLQFSIITRFFLSALLKEFLTIFEKVF